MSLLELISIPGKILRKKDTAEILRTGGPGDQPVFVCDIAKAKKVFGWEPKTAPEDGVKLLYDWVKDNKNLFKDL